MADSENVTPKAGGIKALLEKHGKVLTFMGALIVFGTFVVRDELREHWSQTANAVNMAEYIYSIRVDTSQETTNFRTLANEIYQTRETLLAAGKSVAPISSINRVRSNLQ